MKFTHTQTKEKIWVVLSIYCAGFLGTKKGRRGSIKVRTLCVKGAESFIKADRHFTSIVRFLMRLNRVVWVRLFTGRLMCTQSMRKTTLYLYKKEYHFSTGCQRTGLSMIQKNPKNCFNLTRALLIEYLM